MGGDWQTARIEKIAEKVACGPFGSSIKVSTFVEKGVPVISGQHLHGTRLEDGEYNYITLEHADKLSNANVYPGDVVFTHAGNIGQAAFIPENSKYKRYVLSQRQFYLRPDCHQALPEFIAYFFHSPEGRHKLLANASQTGVPSIARPVSYLKSIEIPIPPLPEQRTIAHILGSLDDKIELNRRMNKALEATARAIFKSWFVDFLPVRAKMAAKANDPKLLLPQAEPGMLFVYAIECEDGSLYIGQTEDLRQRWLHHASGKGGTWTKTHPPKRVVYWERQPSREEAVEREKWLKTGFGRKWLKKEVAANARTQTGDPVHAKAEGRPIGLPDDIAGLFPDRFEDSELGEIPNGWKVKPIGQAVKCVGGSTPSTKNPAFWDGGKNPFVTPKDMSSLTSPVILDTSRHITDAGVDKISSGRLPIGTVILSSRAPIGYLAIAEVPVSVNQGVIAMICNKDLPNYYVLYWTEANMETIKSNAGGTTFAEISKRNFRPIPVIVPAKPILDAFVQQVDPLHKQEVLNLQESNTLAFLRDTLLPKFISGELRVPDADAIAEGVD